MRRKEKLAETDFKKSISIEIKLPAEYFNDSQEFGLFNQAIETIIVKFPELVKEWKA